MTEYYKTGDIQTPIPTLVDHEKEFLSQFFDAWEEFQRIAGGAVTKEKKQIAAQNLVNAANLVRNFRNPVQDLASKQHG